MVERGTTILHGSFGTKNKEQNCNLALKNNKEWDYMLMNQCGISYPQRTSNCKVFPMSVIILKLNQGNFLIRFTSFSLGYTIEDRLMHGIESQPAK